MTSRRTAPSLEMRTLTGKFARKQPSNAGRRPRRAQGSAESGARKPYLGAVEDLVLDAAGSIAGVVTAGGETIRAPAVVLTTGTFLRGVIHLGEETTAAGRVRRRTT